MAFVGGIEEVLHTIQKKRELNQDRQRGVYFTTQNALVEQLYNQSPINYDDIYSFSLDPGEEDGRWSRRAISAATPKKKLEKKIFEVGDVTKYRFPKEDIRRAGANVPASSLSLLLSGKTEEKKKIVLENKLMLTIYLPTGGESFVKINVGEKSNVEQVILAALKQYEQETKNAIKQENLVLNPKAYLLRFAEDDGTPDEDLPALVKSQEIGQFKGYDVFALCQDPNFKEEVVQAPKIRVFRVEIEQKGFVTVIFKDSMTLKELKGIVCIKRSLNEEEYEFQYPSSNSTIPLETKLGDLEDKEGICLTHVSSVKKKKENSKGSIRNTNSNTDVGDAPRQITKLLGPLFFFTPTTATRYHQYVVYKTNKFGARQERYIGIDAERITQTSAEKKNTSSKKPTKLIKDVVSAQILPHKPRHFVIDFKDGGNLQFESPHAEEIVAKVNYLIQMK